MLIYSTNHSQGLLHYVEQKCDVTDNREERTHAHFQRHSPALIKSKSWEILSLYKKHSSAYVGHYLNFWLSPAKSCHPGTVLENRLEGQEGANIHHRVQTGIGGELEGFCVAWQRGDVSDPLCFLCCRSSSLYSDVPFSGVIDRCCSVWIAISSSLCTTQKQSLKYKSFSSNLCRMFFARICALKTLFAVRYLNYIRYMAFLFFFFFSSWN